MFFTGVRIKKIMLLTLAEGTIVSYKSHQYRIKSFVNLEKILLISEQGETVIAPIGELQKPENIQIMPKNEANCNNILIQANNFMELSAESWDKVKTRAEHLTKLIKDKPSVQLVVETALKLGISSRQVYTLIKNYKNAGHNFSGLLGRKSSGGRDKSRLLPEIETIIMDAIGELYCNKQKLKVSVIVEEIVKRCLAAGFNPPSPVTVRSRIKKIPQRVVVISREGNNAARKFSPIIGESPEVTYPLQIVQMDHTLVDLIIVDEEYRKPIGRPYLTVAIDTYSRCINGFYLSLEAPSATSVGLCLLHAVFNKEEWLSKLNIEGSWPIYGKPDLIYVDNATEFHSEALTRGCEFHGIKLEYRPPGQPHYGGIVERMIGTLMQLIHSIPGTTFSNIKERGNYLSEDSAVLTFKELEKWLAIAIVNYYHQKAHSTLLMPPIEKYRLGILGEKGQKGRGYPDLIVNKKAFLVDFLPIERRVLRRQGFVVDHIVYYSNVLTTFIHNRCGTQFLIRRDPRDLSRIYMLDPATNSYLELPYRNLSRPTITLWEHRAALKYLRQQGRSKVDEYLIFKAIEELKTLVKDAAEKSKKIRKEQTKRTLKKKKMET